MIVSIGLHYFYLSLFTWIGLETIHVYRRLSEPQFQIAQRADRQAIQLYYGCGLGLPAVSLFMKTHFLDEGIFSMDFFVILKL